MKKLFLTIVLIAAMIFTGCEKDKEKQLLSQFVIGEWISQSVPMGSEGSVYFYVDITPTDYILSLTDGKLTISLQPANYSVDNKNSTITIDQPKFPDEDPNDEKILFSVAWVENGNTMTWNPIAGDGTEPVLIWIRQ